MGYQNKLPAEKWDIVIALATQICFCSDTEKRKKYRAKYFRILNDYAKKYGEHSSIYASIADFYISDKRAIPLLEFSYQLASKVHNFMNLTFIAESLVNRLLELDDFDPKKSKFWLDTLKKNLKKYSDNESIQSYKEHDLRYKEKMSLSHAK